MGWHRVEFWQPEYVEMGGKLLSVYYPAPAIRKWVRDQYMRGACLRCGGKRRLSFHHVNPSTKCFDIATNVRRTHTVSAWLAEIHKCVTLCGPCHKKVHIHGDPRFFVGTPKKPSGRKPGKKALAQENPSRTRGTLPNDVPNLLGQKEETKPLTT